MREINPKRLALEKEEKTHSIKYGLLSYLHWENMPWLAYVIWFLLKITGIYGWGLRNLLDIQLDKVEIRLKRLPAGFDGFRLLWISDLHIDRIEGQTERLLEIIDSVSFDAGVFGGDSCFEHHSINKTYERMSQIAAALVKRAPSYAILGNHDDSKIIPTLQQAGMRVLLNEHVQLEHNGDNIYLVGVDDCHYYKANDLELAMKGTEKENFKLLLCHSPELYEEAAEAGIDLFLAGHTHGGQVCLPGGRAVVTCCDVPKGLIKGMWKQGGMTGYTSRGVGGSGIPVRFNCPPQIVVFTLRRDDS